MFQSEQVAMHERKLKISLKRDTMLAKINVLKRTNSIRKGDTIIREYFNRIIVMKEVLSDNTTDSFPPVIFLKSYFDIFS